MYTQPKQTATHLFGHTFSNSEDAWKLSLEGEHVVEDSELAGTQGRPFASVTAIYQ
jgi:hypothetical protein